MPTNGVLEKNFPSVYTGFVPAFEEALQTKGGKKKELQSKEAKERGGGQMNIRLHYTGRAWLHKK